MIVIVAGEGDYTGPGIRDSLDELEREAPGFRLFIHGRPSAARKAAVAWCKDTSRIITIYPEIQDVVISAIYSRTASLEKVVCLAAPGGKDTALMMSRCRQAGFDVREVKSGLRSVLDKHGIPHAVNADGFLAAGVVVEVPWVEVMSLKSGAALRDGEFRRLLSERAGLPALRRVTYGIDGVKPGDVLLVRVYGDASCYIVDDGVEESLVRDGVAS